MFRSFSSSSSTSSTESWSSSSTLVSEGSSSSSHYDLLEPVSSSLPEELASLQTLKSPSAQCNAEQTSWHNIQHNPCLALPAREKRSVSLGSLASNSSTKSSLSCSLRKIASHF
ncbi:hypothetical protein BCR35DRAFT_302935 [Leucosporidium creatinivorum]|uniref:Uncharacterized protein n=1 Tax=Leucosporidium creatinivorum TaxID=106004 RepID=A0A1Y2FM15_9BASI|nr:hypothetical protein BCR35DRAFT_302935 [Leucosporidium creatinivorum]